MNLHRTQIMMSQDLEKTVNSDKEVLEFDIDDLYERKVKILYSAIVDFISRSQSNLPSVFSEELYRLRKAAMGIVESVKHIKHLRKNTTRYMVSDNEYMREEYNIMRYKIAQILREIYRHREESTNSEAIAHLDILKSEALDAHDALNTSIQEALNSQRITPMMATSLLNDFNYSDETAKCLVDCAQALLSSHEELLADAEQEIDLDEEVEQATAA